MAIGYASWRSSVGTGFHRLGIVLATLPTAAGAISLLITVYHFAIRDPDEAYSVLGVAAGLFAGGILLYAAAAALGWIVQGFKGTA